MCTPYAWGEACPPAWRQPGPQHGRAGAFPPPIGLGLLAEGAGRVGRSVGVVVVLMPLVYASILGER